MYNKKFTFLIILIIISVTGCAYKSSTNNNKIETQSIEKSTLPKENSKEMRIEESDVKISYILKEYKGDNIAEIPYFEYKGDKNSEIESINKLLNQGLLNQYENFMNKFTEETREWIEIKSYPLVNENYAQVVITNNIFPNYGTSGELESVNYNIYEGIWYTYENILEKFGTFKETVLNNATNAFYEGDYEGKINDIKIVGFLVRSVGERGEYVDLYFKFLLESEDAMIYETFFSYDFETDRLTEIEDTDKYFKNVAKSDEHTSLK